MEGQIVDETTKLQLTVTTEAAERIAKFAPGPRKQGEWLSDLLENYEPEREEGILERIEKRLERIEARLDGIEGHLGKLEGRN